MDEIEKLKDRVEELETQVGVLEDEVADKNKELKAYETTIDEKMEEIADLESVLLEIKNLATK